MSHGGEHGNLITFMIAFSPGGRPGRCRPGTLKVVLELELDGRGGGRLIMVELHDMTPVQHAFWYSVGQHANGGGLGFSAMKSSQVQ